MTIVNFTIRQPRFNTRILKILAVTAGFSVIAGVAPAQVGTPGQLDPNCASACSARGFDGEYCNRVCLVPEPSEIPADAVIDWQCMTTCHARGSSVRDCVRICQRR